MFQVCVGLDLSLTNAGVAVITAPYEVVYRSFGYGIDAQSSERDRLERLLYISNEILGVVREYKARNVGVENYGFASHGKLAMQGELSGVTKLQLLMLTGKVPIVLAAGSVRKYLLGVSSRDKKVKKLVRDHLVGLGYPKPGNLDESDALAVAHLVSDYVNFRDRQYGEYKLGLFDSIDYNRKRTRSEKK